MRLPTTDDLRRRRLIVAGVATILLLIACITYAALTHRAHQEDGATAGSAEAAASRATAGPAPVDRVLAPLRMTDDPEAFAREVAQAIFAWDTATIIGPEDHIEQLVKVGDPTGGSTAGLLADLEDYLPTTDAWTDLAQYETKQWLTINSITTPTKWAEAKAQAGGALLPGTTAYTVHGVCHRAGIWEGRPVASEHDVAFTLFIVCGPSYPDCHLLRLSILDKPLD